MDFNPTQKDIDLVDAIDTSRVASAALSMIVSEEATALSNYLLQFAAKLEHQLVSSYSPLVEIVDVPVKPCASVPNKRLIELRCEAPLSLQIPQNVIRLIAGDNFELIKDDKTVAEMKPWAFVKVLHKEGRKIEYQFLGSKDPVKRLQKGFTRDVYDFVEVGKCYATHSYFISKFGSWNAALECGNEEETEIAAKKLAKLFMKRGA